MVNSIVDHKLPIIYLVTPCGDACELHKTYESILQSALIDQFKVYWVIVHNALSSRALNFVTDKFELIEFVQPDICSAAVARNFALDWIFTNSVSGSWLIFLDSGDLLFAKEKIKVSENVDLLNHRYLIQDCSGSLVSGTNKYPFRYIRNPFYIGSVVLRLDMISGIRFLDGRKEDWKFWLQVLERKPRVKFCDEVLYIYKIKSVKNHLTRKRKLLKDQYMFYHSYLKFSMSRAFAYILMHYTSASVDWLINRHRLKISGKPKNEQAKEF